MFQITSYSMLLVCCRPPCSSAALLSQFTYLPITASADQLALFLRICIMVGSNVQTADLSVTSLNFSGQVHLRAKVIELAVGKHPLQGQRTFSFDSYRDAFSVGSLLLSPGLSETFWSLQPFLSSLGYENIFPRNKQRALWVCWGCLKGWEGQ